MLRDWASCLIPAFGFIPFSSCSLFSFFFWVYISLSIYLLYLSITSYSPRISRVSASAEELNLLTLRFFDFSTCFFRLGESAAAGTEAKRDALPLFTFLFLYEVNVAFLCTLTGAKAEEPERTEFILFASLYALLSSAMDVSWTLNLSRDLGDTSSFAAAAAACAI